MLLEKNRCICFRQIAAHRDNCRQKQMQVSLVRTGYHITNFRMLDSNYWEFRSLGQNKMLVAQGLWEASEASD